MTLEPKKDVAGELEQICASRKKFQLEGVRSLSKCDLPADFLVRLLRGGRLSGLYGGFSAFSRRGLRLLDNLDLRRLLSDLLDVNSSVLVSILV